MKCLVCDNKMAFFLRKSFDQGDFSLLMQDIKVVEYHKCDFCGFVASETHFKMSEERWFVLNKEFHHFLETQETGINQPPYLFQANFLNVLKTNLVLNLDGGLDYAGGLGTLTKVLRKYFGLELLVFDPYVMDENEGFYLGRQDLGSFDLVLNSALFEHLRFRDQFDELNSLVSRTGCLAIHTLVCESIPQDENWFYFEPPVHCSFHTNKSMQILMDQWGYKGSIYCPSAKMWVLFKDNLRHVESSVLSINSEFQTDYLYYKEGFVDYWK